MIAKLNSFGAILIMLTLLYSSTQKSLTYFSYEINKLEIIEKFCINKDQEEYTCEGKCHLNAQLNAIDEEVPFNKKANQTQEKPLVLFNVVFDFIRINYKPEFISVLSKLDSNYRFLFSTKLLRPPIV